MEGLKLVRTQTDVIPVEYSLKDDIYAIVDEVLADMKDNKVTVRYAKCVDTQVSEDTATMAIYITLPSNRLDELQDSVRAVVNAELTKDPKATA